MIPTGRAALPNHTISRPAKMSIPWEGISLTIRAMSCSYIKWPSAEPVQVLINVNE